MANRKVYHVSKNENLIHEDRKKPHIGNTNKAFLNPDEDSIQLTKHIRTSTETGPLPNGVAHLENGDVAKDDANRSEQTITGSTGNKLNECRNSDFTTSTNQQCNTNNKGESLISQSGLTNANETSSTKDDTSTSATSHLSALNNSTVIRHIEADIEINKCAVGADIELEEITRETTNTDSLTTGSFSTQFDYCRGDFERDASTTESSASASTFKRSLSYGDKPSRRRTGAAQRSHNQLDTGQTISGAHVNYAYDGTRIDVDDESWRVSLEEFTSKRYGSKRKSRTLTKQMRDFYEQQEGLVAFYAGWRTYYKNQDALINQYEEIRLEIDDAMENAESVKRLREKASLYAQITFFMNLILLVIKVVAVVMSGSISLISSLVDSAVDLVSGVVIWATTRAVKKTDRYVYPQGRTKLEPMSIVILSVIMSVASLQIIKESVSKIVNLANGSTSPPLMYVTTIGISSATVLVKLALYLLCRRVPHPTVQALAMDHRNDVVSNFFAIVFGYIGSQEMLDQTGITQLVYTDPIGAIVISIYIIGNWCVTGWDQIKLLIGHTAHQNFISKITWICLDHHRNILKVDTVRAFHFGNNFLVEADIVLPPEMSLREAHDIAEPLQQKIERLPQVEKAFVHIDYETTHDPRIEHNVH